MGLSAAKEDGGAFGQDEDGGHNYYDYSGAGDINHCTDEEAYKAADERYAYGGKHHGAESAKEYLGCHHGQRQHGHQQHDANEANRQHYAHGNQHGHGVVDQPYGQVYDLSEVAVERACDDAVEIEDEEGDQQHSEGCEYADVGGGDGQNVAKEK